ncbi:hypothetical protein L4C34_12950 [Vibrio profundum]|uniref:hypothetical protein n=1 Tax=Vibrio profundum TaxID=2910247 RepID=UPI003D0B6B8F
MIVEWSAEHNCIFEAVILPGKMQLYVSEKELSKQSILHYFLDYDEGYQACLDRLADVKNQ